MSGDYVIRVDDSPAAIDATDWDGLLFAQAQPTPFLRHAYLMALQESGSACAQTGWQCQVFSLWEPHGLQPPTLAAACVLYLKRHSRGEYVFDFAWADAHARMGLRYYPKAVVAVPFTPVPGTRLLARSEEARARLLDALVQWCAGNEPSSLHLLFVSEADAKACTTAGLTLRHGVQFHWENQGWPDFDNFLAALRQDKRKKIRQERRKVQEAGITVRGMRGPDISAADWDFFYRCYTQTYYEHGNPPYLNAAFFDAMARTMPDHWLMFVAERDAEPVAASLIALSDDSAQPGVAYGRYWGALQRFDCLHFELCYYQPLEWCIAHGVQRFEGGAQGEHKMARALLPTPTVSAHWLANPVLARAVTQYLERESTAVNEYREVLQEHSPLRKSMPEL